MKRVCRFSTINSIPPSRTFPLPSLALFHANQFLTSNETDQSVKCEMAWNKRVEFFFMYNFVTFTNCRYLFYNLRQFCRFPPGNNEIHEKSCLNGIRHLSKHWSNSFLQLYKNFQSSFFFFVWKIPSFPFGLPSERRKKRPR